jgi:hypothetical protein
MNSYRIAFLVSVILISLPSVFLVVVGIVNFSASRIVFWGGMLILWWLRIGIYIAALSGHSESALF